MVVAKLVIEPKKWLGDNKILKMDWDVRGMHFHLMLLAWQNFPQGAIEADEKLLARFLNTDSSADDWKNRIRPQLLSVWTKKTLPNEAGEPTEYYVQPGLIKEVEKQNKPKKTTKAPVAKKSIPVAEDAINSGFDLLDIFKEELSPEEKAELEAKKLEESVQRQQDSMTIWKLGAQLLVGDSMTETKARAFLGKLAKEYGANNLAAAIAQITVKKTNPVEAKSYLVSLLKNQQVPKQNFKTPHNQASGKLIL